MDFENSSQLEFMKLVEKGESKVYLEEITPKRLLLYFFLPLFLGMFTSIATFVITTTMGFLWDLLSLFVVLLVPTGVGFILALTYLVRSVRKSNEFGVRGIARTDLSVAIAFLDMIKEGEAEVGRIIDPNSPEEYSYFNTNGLSLVIRVLNKIDPGMGSKWFEVVFQKLSQAFSFREKLFLRTIVFGTLIAVIIGFALEILMRVGLIDGLLALYLLVGDVIIGLILCIALVGYVIRNRNKDPPEKVELAIREPEVRTETEYVLTRLFRFFFEESKHPLRILVMGNYDDLKYTGRILTTSREMTLREAVLLPRHS